MLTMRLSAFLATICISVTTFTACSTKNNVMKSVIYTPSAPAPIGPYSQAIEAGGFVFVSGQIAIDPVSGDLYSGENIQAETRMVMENLKAIITQAGCSMNDVVKCTIFLKDMNYFGDVNSVYGEYFLEYAPARETVAVAGLPKNVRVEISAVVLKR
jgi:2-iminobutanoate/2-iminopropanoate deaminase